jgi:acetolactate synthase-1/2/3 large subunit
MAGTTVADLLADGLARAGAARVFAGPGSDEALLDAARRRGLDVVAASDASLACVLGAVTGELGDGPGAAVSGLGDAPGLVRGLAHAQRDRAPMIVVTEAGADAGLLAPVVKASVVVEPASAAHWIAHAAHLAMADPRGPVHLVVAPGVASAPALAVATSVRAAPLPAPSEASLAALGAALAGATRPLLVAGLECGPDDARWLRAFAESLPAPVLATAKGKGALADPHPLALGALAAAHPALARADLVLLVGVDGGELPPGLVPAGVRMARIGRSPWTGGGLVAEALGDLALVIEELAPRVRARDAADWDVAELDRIKRAVTRQTAATPAGRVVALAREATPAGTLATAEVPSLAAWQAVAPREALTPLGMSIPGYAVAAAVAAQLADPARRVVAFTTPAGFEAAAPAWALAVSQGLPIMVVRMGGRSDAGLPPSDEFSATFGRAFLARRPALVDGQP